MGLLSAIGKVVPKIFGGGAGGLLGGPIGAIASSVVGGGINRFFAGKQKQDELSMYTDMGLTPQEIMGGGGASGGESAGTTVGNMYAQRALQSQQLAFQQQEADKNRALQMRAQDMGLLQAQTSAAVGHGANALAQRRLDEIDAPQAANDLITTSPDFRFRALQMAMGVENVFVEGLAKRYGISLSNDSFADMSQDKWESFVADAQYFRSQIATESNAAGSQLLNSIEGFGDGIANIFRRNPLRRENWRETPPPSVGSGSSRGQGRNP